MKLISCLPAALGLLIAAVSMSPAALAQERSSYSLHDDRIQFRAPAGWVAIMEKTGGPSQAIAFQIPDNSAQGSEDIADATVKTRELKDASEFNAFLEGELDRPRAQAGYEVDTSNADGAVHQYFVTNGPTRYLVRDSFMLRGDIAVEVRCRRPLLANTSDAWKRQFDSACDALVASLKNP